MFKFLVLQALYSLSDDAAEFQVRDRLSFMRFLGLGLGHRVRDAKTIWLFREQLVRADAVEVFDPRALMVQSSHLNGRMRYGPGSPWERHDDGAAVFGVKRLDGAMACGP